jgi:DNA-binding MarR family transcriptional regulator
VAVTEPLGKLVFARLDGTHTPADLAAGLGVTQEAVNKQLKDIFELGLLEA